MFVQLVVKVLSSEVGPCFSLWRVSYSLGHSWECLGVPKGSLLTPKILDVTLFHYRKFHWVTRKFQLRFRLHYAFSFLFRSPSYMYVFYETSTVLCFYPKLQMTLSFAVPSNICYLTSLFSQFPHLMLPF